MTLVPGQWQLYKGIDHDTLAALHDELYRRTLHGGWPDATLTPGVAVRTAGRVGTTKIELHLDHTQQGTRSRLTTDAVVLATGYRERRLDTLLAALDPYLRRDNAGRPRIDAHHRLTLDPAVTGSVYVQNAERHTHGVGAPDLGLAAWRSATILNTLTDTPRLRPPQPYRLHHLRPPATLDRPHRLRAPTGLHAGTPPLTAPHRAQSGPPQPRRPAPRHTRNQPVRTPAPRRASTATPPTRNAQDRSPRPPAPTR